MDPYDYVANSLPAGTKEAIGLFWAGFAEKADALDGYFSGSATDADPTAVMAPLKEVSPELMWEFGPSDRGHLLCISAEWQDVNRPLARAMLRAAPDLPRWRFADIRAAAPADQIADLFASRFPRHRLPTALTATPGPAGRVDITFTPAAPDAVETDGTLGLLLLILGEADDRDWLGYIDPKPPKGLLSRFKRTASDPIDLARTAEAVRAAIAEAKALRPEKPYAALDSETRPASLFQLEPGRDGHPRPDLFTYSATDERLARNILSGERFASICHSAHGEWFLCVVIARTGAQPFDQVEDRTRLEDRLHDTLSGDGLGGFAASGHGTDHVYIDLAVTDIDQGIARIEQTLSGIPDARLHFPDAGLADLFLPLHTAAPQH